MGNIQDGELDLEKLKYLPQDHDEFPDLLLEPGDLLFNRTNSAELVGKTAVFRGTPGKCSYASYLIAARTFDGCDPEFIAMYINSWHGRSWIKTVVSQQVGQANVNGTKLKALSFPLPPVAEQAAIMSLTQPHFDSDHTSEVIKLNLTRADRLRQTILKSAFEGNLAVACLSGG